MPNFARRSFAAIADRDGCKDVWVAISGMMLPLTSPASSLRKNLIDDLIKPVVILQMGWQAPKFWPVKVWYI